MILHRSYSAATQEDLWTHLTDQAHKDETLDSDITVKEVMDTWTLQMGYPVLRVRRDSDGTALLQQVNRLSRYYKTFKTFVTFQERFILNLDGPTTNDEHIYMWYIPINYATQDDPNFNISTPECWMTPMEGTKTIESGLPTLDKWVIFNRAQTGYYRVNYDQNNWELIIAQLKKDHRVISNINKAQLIDDSMELARAGKCMIVEI